MKPRSAPNEPAPQGYLLGRDRVRVYDGSWAEWGRMADAPVTAEQP
jgi:3-mercaptopyruvate sulfurtransferase SseA